MARNVGTHFPPGFIGNPHVAAKCTLTEFSTAACPPDSQVGITYLLFGLIGPVYNMETRPNQAGMIAFSAPLINAPIMLDITGRTDSDYGLSVEGSALPQETILSFINMDLWGVPASTEHNFQRFVSPLDGRGLPA